MPYVVAGIIDEDGNPMDSPNYKYSTAQNGAAGCVRLVPFLTSPDPSYCAFSITFRYLIAAFDPDLTGLFYLSFIIILRLSYR